MSNNSENERSVTTSKMYPIDLAPQKITIVKSVSNSDMKMTHLVPGQTITTGASQIITATGPISLMRPSTQIISSSGTPQAHMLVSNSPILPNTQIVSQGSQVISQGSQILPKTQLIGPGGQLISPGTQIISQGTQLNAQISNNANVVSNIGPVSAQGSAPSGGQILNMGGVVAGGGNLVVSSTVRTIPPSVRVLPPMSHHNARPVLSSMNIGNNIGGAGPGVVVSKTISSHVPRGPAAGASLAVPRVAARPITPVSQTVPISSLGAAWSQTAARGVRGAVVYSARGPRPPLASAPAPAPAASTAPAPLAPLAPSHLIAGATSGPVSGLSISTVQGATPGLNQSASLGQTASIGANSLGHTASSPNMAHVPLPAVVNVPAPTGHITNSVITTSLRAAAPAPRPVPLVQRNFQPTAKVVGVSNIRNPVGNSAPAQLYYEVPRAAAAVPRVRGKLPHTINNQVNVINAIRSSPESRPPSAPAANVPTSASLPRPTILRKRDIEGSPSKGGQYVSEWAGVAEGGGGGEGDEPGGGGEREGDGEREGEGGSTTESAASSPAPDDEPPETIEHNLSPRKKPRKQMLTNEVRQCEYPTEDRPPTPPPVVIKPPPKRPQLRSSYVCGWRATALHFARPSDVRRREPRPRDILAIASQRHVRAAADGWKVHHITAQMEDLVSLESDVSEQLANVLRTLESAHGKAQAVLAPQTHALLELVKGNIQRSRIVCEGVQEAREDILRVFTHRTFVSDILSRQADKRCFRKHRLQS